MFSARTFETESAPLTEFSCSLGEFRVSIDARDGMVRSRNPNVIPDQTERDAVTHWAIQVLTRCGHPPASPLAVRDLIWG